MADLGHELTEKKLKKLERQVKREYKTAVGDMEAKLKKYLDDTEVKRQYWEGLYKAGQISKQEYENWCFNHRMVGKRWKAMLDTLTADMHHANEIALKIARDTMPDIYALNHNYNLYQIETTSGINTGLSLYNHDTAEHLLKDQRQLMPGPSTKKAAEIAANKDMQWNMKKIQSAVFQGVIQGESAAAVAKRLQTVGQMNYNSAVRYARTMATSAQNAGRYESCRRAAKIGVELTIEWQAVLDGRTRHDHRLMHGQRRDLEEPFVTPDRHTIYYPADCTGRSDAPQSEIWNCRCTLRPWVKGFEGDTVKQSPGMNGMSFEEWQNAKPDYKKNNFTSGRTNGNVASRGVSSRNMANGLRKSPSHILTEAEIKSVYEDADAIGVPRSLLRFNTGARTGYSDLDEVINIRGDIFPDLNSSYNRDLMSKRAALAHEYYGHYMTRGTTLEPGDWRDEFRASFRAAKNTPNLTTEERQMLMRDALDRAKDAGVTITPTGTVRRLLYGIDEN